MITKHANITRKTGAFTLVEMMVATSILVFIVVALASISGSVNRAWSEGEQRVENFQNGRAIIELLSREISIAAPPRRSITSTSLQFVQDPQISSLISGSSPQVANSSSLFWQAPIASNGYGNMCEVGYYLINATSGNRRQLQRFFAQPDSLTATNKSNIYKIYCPYSSYSGYKASPWPPPEAALWLTTLTSANFQGASSMVSDSVAALWFRCLDTNGYPIPWLSAVAATLGSASATTLKFNSAAYFSPGSAMPSSAGFSLPRDDTDYYTNPKFQDYRFQYTGFGSQQAQLLPAAVEITIVTVDSRIFQHSNIALPQMQALTTPQDVPSVVQAFNQQLIESKITSARTFTTTVKLSSTEN